MTRYLLMICSFFCLSIALKAQPKIIDKVIASVGDRIILHSEVEDQYRYLEAQQGSIPEEARCYILDQLMTQQLLLVQAKKDSVEISETDVNAQVDARMEQILSMMGDESQFKAYYGMTVIEAKNKFREDMEDQMLAQRMQTSVVADVDVTPSEVKRFFGNIPKDSLPYLGAEVEIGELVFKPKVSKEEWEKARVTLSDLRARIVDGREDFASLAQQFSDDEGSRERGGDLGWVRRGSLVPEFEAAVFNLSENEYSKLIKTEYGLHLIQLYERRGNAVHARHILIKPKINEADKAEARAELEKIRNLIVADTMSFIQAVRKYSEDEQSKNNAGNMINYQTGSSSFEIGELAPEVYFSVDTLEVGEISYPVEFDDFSGDPAYKLLLLKSRTQPHIASLKQDYSRIKKAAIEEKKVRYMADWVETKVDQNYIYIDPRFQSCEILNKWTVKKRGY